ncbi:glycogen debranching N-terminal domain-containing protein [Amycolatopsis sp. NPDC004625]|uniref:glycogen debranching N-terminal domain-containing protein n=1 Tax=Amycolatopsis sp. NPDC004625 TaxID=3154670 RepID=UPI0033B2D911
MTGSSTALHSLVTVLNAPSVVCSLPDGRLSGRGATGWFSHDVRALSLLEFAIADVPTVAVGHDQPHPSTASFHAVARESESHSRDATLLVEQRREVSAARLGERFTVINFGDRRRLTITLRVATDFAGMDAVKAGRTTALVPPIADDLVSWRNGHGTTVLRAKPAGMVSAGTGSVATVTWHVEVGTGESWHVDLTADAAFRPGGFEQHPAAKDPQWTLPDGLPAVAAKSLEDLRALLLADPESPDDGYLAAGAPWYLTLFGRDSLWAARLLLPLGGDLAAGTLRTLARRQGTRYDADTEEQPGKILHEIRAAPIDTGQVQLSSRYYGTIDATPLWICLFRDAWRAGLPADEVHQLLPHMYAAMDWLTGTDADPDDDGLIEYQPSRTGGLTHQGWKDSHDAFLHDDGTHPLAPLALCEAQGYAYAAAQAAVELGTAFNRAETAAWADWARRLEQRFRETFWIDDESGRYPAIALDSKKNPIHGATSNMAHLLGTGLLDRDEAALVAERLDRPDLTTRFGLRTLSSASPSYNPFSYHRGSIWPHDTAIAMTGLAAEGHHGQAHRLAETILRTAEHFDGHVPELFALLDGSETPLAYPAACRPQAWSAAAVVRAGVDLHEGR